MLIRLFLVLSFLTFNVFADEVDFSKVDCNSVETRKALIEEIIFCFFVKIMGIDLVYSC